LIRVVAVKAGHAASLRRFVRRIPLIGLATLCWLRQVGCRRFLCSPPCIVTVLTVTVFTVSHLVLQPLRVGSICLNHYEKP
jgi:hypothetical protein